MPVTLSPMETVVVPSGATETTDPHRPGITPASSRKSSWPGWNSSSSGMRSTVKAPSTPTFTSGRTPGGWV